MNVVMFDCRLYKCKIHVKFCVNKLAIGVKKRGVGGGGGGGGTKC